MEIFLSGLDKFKLFSLLKSKFLKDKSILFISDSELIIGIFIEVS